MDGWLEAPGLSEFADLHTNTYTTIEPSKGTRYGYHCSIHVFLRKRREVVDKMKRGDDGHDFSVLSSR